MNKINFWKKQIKKDDKEISTDIKVDSDTYLWKAKEKISNKIRLKRILLPLFTLIIIGAISFLIIWGINYAKTHF